MTPRQRTRITKELKALPASAGRALVAQAYLQFPDHYDEIKRIYQEVNGLPVDRPKK